MLRVLAPGAHQGFSILESEGCSIFHTAHEIPVSLDILRETSGGFTFRSIWGSWSSDDEHERSLEHAFHVLINILYGSSHLAAWNTYFPTPAERWLLHISALFLVTVPIWGGLWMQHSKLAGGNA